MCPNEMVPLQIDRATGRRHLPGGPANRALAGAGGSGRVPSDFLESFADAVGAGIGWSVAGQEV